MVCCIGSGIYGVAGNLRERENGIIFATLPGTWLARIIPNTPKIPLRLIRKFK